MGGETGVRLECRACSRSGSLCGVSDPDAVLRASSLCDELGIDTISAGGTIAFAMECVERGWLDEPWLTFGSGDAMLRAIELVGRREGVGEPAGRGQPPCGRDDRARQHRVRSAGEGPRDSRLRAAGAADDGARLRGRRPRRGPQSQRRLRGRLLGQGGSPARDARCGPLCHRNRGQGRADGLADHLQVPSRACSRTSTPRPPTCCTGSPAGTRPQTNCARQRGASSASSGSSICWPAGRVDEDTLPARFLDTPLPSDPTAAINRQQLEALRDRVSPPARLVGRDAQATAGPAAISGLQACITSDSPGRRSTAPRDSLPGY